MPSEEVRGRLAAIRSGLGGRAAGAWRSEGGRLILVAFDPAADLPVPVAIGFEEATRSVDLTRVNLGIVRAAVSRRISVSVAAELPADSGSGQWLRAFGASRSVAVPITDEEGRVAGVISVALGPEPTDDAVASAIRGGGWAG